MRKVFWRKYVASCLLLLSLSKVYGLDFFALGKFECKKNETLVCKSQNDPMTCILQTGTMQLVICAGGDCIVNPNTPADYIISHNYTERYINLTIMTVSLDVESTMFQCDGDAQVLTIKPIVSVYPSKMIYDDKNAAGVTSVNATTDCIKSSKKIEFKWFKTETKTISIGTQLPFSEYNHTVITDDMYCISNASCNGTGYTSAISFFTPDLSLSKAYYLQCVVYEGNTSIFINVTEHMIPLPERSDAGGADLSTGAIVGIIVGVLVPTGLIISIIVVALRMRYGVSAQEQCGVPYDFHATDVQETSASFTCTPALNKSRQDIILLCVAVLGNTSDTEKNIRVEHVKGGEPVCLTIGSLKPNQEYQCFVLAENSNKERSPMSEYITITTLGKPQPPTDLKEQEEERTSSSITVCWTPGQYRRQTQMFIIKYGLTRRNKELIKWKEDRLLDDPHRKTLSYKINGLKPGTKYTISVVAQNDYGFSEMMSRSLKVKTNGVKENEDRLMEND